LRAVPGHIRAEIQNANQAREIGKELGSVHLLLRDFKKPLKKCLPMFQYPEHLKKLRGYKTKFLKDSSQKRAK